MRLAALLWTMAMAGPSQAAVPDSFPDQPGALTAEEIQVATRTMQATHGAELNLPLAASGKRSPGHSMPAYAVFAGPLTDFSDRVRTRRLIICNLFGADWRCGDPLDEMRMSANGLEHVFYYQVVQGAGDKQVAADAVDYLYSQCYARQFAGLGGTPVSPSPDTDYVNTVMQEGNAFTVITGPLGQGDSYRMQKTDKKVDGCGFTMLQARSIKTGALYPASGARALAKAMQEGVAQRRMPAGGSSGLPIVDKLTDFLVALTGLLGVAALIGPFAVLARGRKAAAHMAVVLTTATLILAAVVGALLKLASLTDIGYSLPLVISVTALAGLSCIIWLVLGAAARPQ